MTISRRQLMAAGALSPMLLAANPWLARLMAEEKEEGHRFQEITAESTKAADSGIAFLLKTLHRDGSAGVDLAQPSDIGCTAILGLALMAQGNTPIEGAHAAQVRSVTNYLLQAIKNMPSYDITSATDTQLQRKIGRHAHSFFAALFLSQVIGEGWEVESVKAGLSKLVSTIAKAQTADGSWAGQSWAPMLGTVMGWCCLRGAHFAGFNVKASADKVADHIVKHMKQNIGGADGGGSWMHTLYKNATGVRVLYAIGQDKDPASQKAFKDVVSLVTKDSTPFTQAGGEEYLAFHLITETMLQKGGADWKTWFPNVRDKICKVQNADGSWTGLHCITSRTFCTAAAVLVLSAPNRYLPISQRQFKGEDSPEAGS